MEASIKKNISIIPAKPAYDRSIRPQMRTLRVAAYCRVSTLMEQQESSYEAQVQYYTEKIRSNPNWKLAGIYADDGKSATSTRKRADFQSMIDDCMAGKIDMVITKSISRFARNTVDSLTNIRKLKEKNIAVFFEKEGINTLEGSGELLITILSSQAQEESRNISENCHWGIVRRFEAGQVIVNHNKFLGYTKDKDGNLVVVPEEAELVRRIYRLFLEGNSSYRIKRILESEGIRTVTGNTVWQATVIDKMLTNEKYMGDALLQKTYTVDFLTKKKVVNKGIVPQYYIEDDHEAIIPKELFYRVQEEMARRSSKRKVMQKTGKTELGKYSAKYALSELLVCGECGTPYKRVTWARNGKKRIVWRCISRLEFGTKYCHNSPTLDEEKLHQAIQEAINEFVQAGTEVKEDMLTFTAMAWGGNTVGGVSLIDLRQKLKDITDQQALLLDQVLEHMDDEILNARLKAMMDEKQALQERIADAEQSETHNAAQESRMAELREWMAKLEVNQQYSDEQVRMAVERITVVDAETIRIRFRYPGAELEKKL